MTRTTAIALAAVLALVTPPSAFAAPTHGIAMQGEPALSADFAQLPYANPDAPQGGEITYGVIGTFDSLNPFILKSMRTSARGLWDPIFDNLTIESLMKRSRDEAFTLYGLLAEKVDVPDDRSSIEFFLHPKATFSDGEPVKVSDVLFSFSILRDKGRPPYSTRMRLVEKMEQTGPRSVKLTFTEDANRETPLLFGLMPIFAEHATDPETFESSSLVKPIGSGPYTIGTVRPGEKVIYEKNPDYWGRDLPINRGHFNFETVSVDYYRNSNALFEAFKKGLFDLNRENSPAKWARDYDFPAAQRGDVVKEVFEPGLPSGMLGLAFNTRRPIFAESNVRKALAKLFDFEWANENLFSGAYERTSSYWQGSELSAFATPASEDERALLASFPSAVEPEVMDGTYRAPQSDGSGRDRKLLREALTLFREAGYQLKGGKLVDAEGKPFRFELLVAGDAGMSGQEIERLALNYAKSAARIGVEVSVRTVDDSQYQARKTNYEYDMIVARFTSSLSPGAEQSFRWGSAARDQPGTFNFTGASDPALDAMIAAILSARTRADFVTAVRAFDRVLISGHYVVPLYHSTKQYVAYRSKLEHPEKTPLYGPWYATWWSKKAK